MIYDEAEGSRQCISTIGPDSVILVMTRRTTRLIHVWPLVQESRTFALIERTHWLYRIQCLHQVSLLSDTRSSRPVDFGLSTRYTRPGLLSAEKRGCDHKLTWI